MTQAAVGEKHSLALQSWCSAPASMRARLAPAQALASRPCSGLSEVRSLSQTLSEGLSSGPLDSMDALLAAERGPGSEGAAYWQSLDGVPGPGSRSARTKDRKKEHFTIAMHSLLTHCSLMIW